MDEPTGEPARCTTCGEHHPMCFEAVFDGMTFGAYRHAHDRLSEQGREELATVDDGMDTIGFDETWTQAEGVDHLPDDEVREIEIYVARRTMVDAARREEGLQGPSPRP